jgi:hypothetical protein
MLEVASNGPLVLALGTQLIDVPCVLSGMQLTRHIFDTTIGKILMPWITIGFGGAMLALATELIEVAREFHW